jgi:hypothetical protein
VELLRERRAKSASVIKHAYKFHLALKAVRNVKEEKRRRGLVMEQAEAFMAGIPSSFKMLSAACAVTRCWLLHYRRTQAGEAYFEQLMSC